MNKLKASLNFRNISIAAILVISSVVMGINIHTFLEENSSRDSYIINEKETKINSESTAPEKKLLTNTPTTTPTNDVQEKNDIPSITPSPLTDPGPSTKKENIDLVNPMGDESCKGYRVSRGFVQWHKGYDIAHTGDCWILASGDGTVLFAGWRPYGEGYMVVIDHGNGFITKYQHGNGQFKVKKGDFVKKGNLIMHIGSTGMSTGQHLHFELNHNGQPINPAPYIKF